jgi:hypothetical protein
MKFLVTFFVILCFVFTAGTAIGKTNECPVDRPPTHDKPSPEPSITVSSGDHESDSPADECCMFYNDSTLKLVMPPECDNEQIREFCTN